MLPEVFAQPAEYQPDRFAPPREEDKAVPYGFVGFGGGRHGCLGSNFAFLQVRWVWGGAWLPRVQLWVPAGAWFRGLLPGTARRVFRRVPPCPLPCTALASA